MHFSTSDGNVYLKNIWNYVFFLFGNLILSTKKQKIESYEAFQSYISKPRLEFILVLCSTLWLWMPNWLLVTDIFHSSILFCFSPTPAIPKVPRIILLPFNYPVSHLAKTYPHLVTFCSLILTKLITCYTSTHFVETLYLLPDLIHRNFKDYNLKQKIKYQYVGGFSDGVWNWGLKDILQILQLYHKPEDFFPHMCMFYLKLISHSRNSGQ